MGESVAKGTWKDRLGYFWMYYKIPVFLIVVAVIVIVSFVHTNLTQKTSCLDAALFDIHSSAEENALETDFEHYAGINTKKYAATISTSLMLSDSSSSSYSMGSLARLYTETGTGKLDVCAMRKKDFKKYEKAGIFLDLSKVLPKEELEKYSVRRDKSGAVTGLYLKDSSRIKKIGGYPKRDGVVGILKQSKHIGAAKQFLRWLR